MHREQATRASGGPLVRWLVIALLAVSLVVGAWAAYGAIGQSLREQGALSMRAAIINAAMQCCAIEGAYPMTIGYLEEHYGLRVNRADYVVMYEAFADNVLPSVVVMPR